MRKVAARVLDWLLGRPALVRSVKRHARAKTAILCYHNIVADSELLTGVRDASLHMPAERFASHLAALAEAGARFLSLDDFIRGNTDGALDVVITFDDAYAGAVSAGLKVAAARNAPVTVFVSPGILGQQSMWWDRLGLGGPNGISWSHRERLLWSFEGDNRRILKEFDLEGGASLRGSALTQIATLEDIHAALRVFPQLRLGSHTWSHVNLPSLSSGRSREELTSSRKWLQQTFKAAYVNAVALPYGLSDATVLNDAFSVGYDAVLTLGGHWESRYHTAIPIARFNVPSGMSAKSLMRRLVLAS